MEDDEKFELQKFCGRTKVPIYTKYKVQDSSNVINCKRKKEYDYFICDFCGNEIEIKKKQEEMVGGIDVLPYSLTGMHNLKIALCNKCVKPLLKELEKIKMESDTSDL